MADVRAGAVAVVGGRLHEQRHAARAVALVEDRLQRLGVGALAGALGDGALDVVLGHRGVLGLLDGQPERRVALGVAAALLGGHRDGARELGEELAAARVDDRLLVLDPRPLGMTGHGFDASDEPPPAVERRMRAMADRTDRRARPRRLARRLVLGRGRRPAARRRRRRWSPSTCRASPRAATCTTTRAPCARCSIAAAGRRDGRRRALLRRHRHHRGAPPAPRACATCVYLTAFMLDEGESLATSPAARRPTGRSPDADGRTLSVAGAQEVFYNTCPPEVADAAAARLRPHTIASFVQPVHLGRLARRALDLRHLRPRPRDPGAGAGGDVGAGGHHAPPRERPLAVPQRPRRRRRPHPRRAPSWRAGI